ncbi:nuclear transport factor 2 family protein [Streptomyces sp. NBC_00028]|uniref:nuclear transport factor 2 family protein n=1 Tax=Streptomyces sp. NBC_00028 TaxID=2975624 RepID=UPI00324C3FCB
MSEVDDFLPEVLPRLRVAEIALHRGDARPRKTLWSHGGPVALFGAETSRSGWSEVGPMSDWVAGRFTECTSSEYEVVAAGVGGDLACLVAIGRITGAADGVPTSYALRVTTAFRKEDGTWKAVHRHGDPWRQCE